MTNKTKNKKELLPSQASAITFVSVFLLLVTYLVANGLHVLDQRLISLVFIVPIAISAFVISLTSFYKVWKAKNITSTEKKFLFFALSTSTAIGFVSAVIGYLASLLLPLAFKNIPYTALGISLAEAGLAGFVVYFIVDYVSGLNQRKFSLLILMTFLSGFFVSAVNSQDHSWWQWSICSLGMPINKTEFYYNFTMILTGILILGLGFYLRPQLNKIAKKGFLSTRESKILIFLFFVAGVVVSLVGVFPYGISRPLDFIHVFFGYYAFAHIGLVILFSKWLFGKFPKKFFVTSYIIWITSVIYYFTNLYFLVFPAAIAEIVVMIVAVIWTMSLIKTMKVLSETALVTE